MFRHTRTECRKEYNKVANFMPKPLFDKNDPFNGGDNGSGMHSSIGLWNESPTTNIFYDSDDYYAGYGSYQRDVCNTYNTYNYKFTQLISPRE